MIGHDSFEAKLHLVDLVEECRQSKKEYETYFIQMLYLPRSFRSIKDRLVSSSHLSMKNGRIRETIDSQH